MLFNILMLAYGYQPSCLAVKEKYVAANCCSNLSNTVYGICTPSESFQYEFMFDKGELDGIAGGNGTMTSYESVVNGSTVYYEDGLFKYSVESDGCAVSNLIGTAMTTWSIFPFSVVNAVLGMSEAEYATATLVSHPHIFVGKVNVQYLRDPRAISGKSVGKSFAEQCKYVNASALTSSQLCGDDKVADGRLKDRCEAVVTRMLAKSSDILKCLEFVEMPGAGSRVTNKEFATVYRLRPSAANKEKLLLRYMNRGTYSNRLMKIIW